MKKAAIPAAFPIFSVSAKVNKKRFAVESLRSVRIVNVSLKALPI